MQPKNLHFEYVCPIDLTMYVHDHQVKSTTYNLRKQGYDIVSIEHITRGKVVIYARDRFAEKH